MGTVLDLRWVFIECVCLPWVLCHWWGGWYRVSEGSRVTRVGLILVQIWLGEGGVVNRIQEVRWGCNVWGVD